MSEQWYLDLDGVRSGPYQTSEVMSLVAEGEVLPHHQIATELKSQKWSTILEWRLQQNKAHLPNQDSAPASTKFSIPTEEVKVNPEPVIETEPVEVQPSTPTPEPEAKPIQEEIKSEPTPVAPPEAPKNTTNKRDPMAEMFDMVQNNKQKRVSKTQSSQTHVHQHAHHHSHSNSTQEKKKAPTEKNGMLKTIVVGALITMIGFALGQYFQHQKLAKEESKVAESKIQSESSKKPNPEPTIEPAELDTEDPVTEEVIEKSTDKMTIRAHVPAKNKAETSSTPPDTQELEELKDLKKELMELKALKDEMRGGGMHNNSLDSASPDGSETELDENGNPIINDKEDTHF